MNKAFLCAFAAAALALAGCNKTATNEIPVGEFASLTGKEATFGISSHEGTVLAIEEINAAGGVLGKSVKLLTEDNQSKAGESANAVNKLIAKDGVVAILGEVASSRSLEAAPICQQNKIPMISPCSTNPKVTETGDYIFRVCFIDPFQGTVMANFAQKTLKAQKVAVFTDVKSDYSKGLAKFFKEGFAKAGGQIVAELDYNGGDKDFKGQLTAIKSAQSRWRFRARLLHRCRADLHPGEGSRPHGAALRRRRLGEREADRDRQGRRRRATTSARTTRPMPAAPKGKAFVEAYKKRYNGKSPDAMAALGYDSAHDPRRCHQARGHHRWPESARRARRHEGFRRGHRQDHDQRERDADKSAVILQVKDGKFATSKRSPPSLSSLARPNPTAL